MRLTAAQIDEIRELARQTKEALAAGRIEPRRAFYELEKKQP